MKSTNNYKNENTKLTNNLEIWFLVNRALITNIIYQWYVNVKSLPINKLNLKGNETLIQI